MKICPLQNFKILDCTAIKLTWEVLFANKSVLRVALFDFQAKNRPLSRFWLWFMWKPFQKEIYSKNLNKFMLNMWNWTCGCLTQEYSHRKRIIFSGDARIPFRTGYWKYWVAKAFAELKIENPDTSSKKWKCAQCLRSWTGYKTLTHWVKQPLIFNILPFK